MKLAFGNTVGSTTYLTEMKDRNGNQIKATYVAGTGKLDRVEDTLGTAAIFYYDAQGYLQRVLSLGTTKTRIDFTYQSKYLNPSFSIPAQAATEKVLASATIFLPLKDLRQSYEYDGYGALMRVTNTVIDYAYDSGQPYCRGQEIGRRDDILVAYQYQTVRFRDQLYGFVEERVVVSKNEYVLNSGSPDVHTWQISYSVDQTKSNPSTVYVTDEKGRSDYDFFHTVNGRTWSDGLLQRVQRRTSASASPPLQLLRTEETAWTQDNTSVGYIVSPRVTSRTSTLETAQSSHTDFAYADDGTGNVREVKE
ncbi:MAG: hypothetical protein HXY20_12250 [Acidobacteria bacterium]|nr:hypothetical protein [Acidobacteriota bacterium]